MSFRPSTVTQDKKLKLRNNLHPNCLHIKAITQFYIINIPDFPDKEVMLRNCQTLKLLRKKQM